MGSRNDSGKPYDLDHQLETCIQEFERDRQAYWQNRTDGGDWGPDRLHGFAERMAKTLLSDINHLVMRECDGPESKTFNDECGQYFKQVTDLTDLVRSKLAVKHVPTHMEDLIESFADENRPPKDSLLALVWELFSISLAEDLVTGRLLRGANRMLDLSGY